MNSIPVHYGRAPYYTGLILCTAEYSSTGEITNVTAKWEGEALSVLSKVLIDDLDPRWGKLDGDMLTICQYTLKVLAYYPAAQVYIALRIAPPMDETAPTTIDEIEF